MDRRTWILARAQSVTVSFTAGGQKLIQAEQQGRVTELTINGDRAEVRVLRDGLTRASGVTLVGESALVLVEFARSSYHIPYDSCDLNITLLNGVCACLTMTRQGMNLSRAILMTGSAAFALACKEPMRPEQGSRIQGEVQLQDSWGNKLASYSGVTVNIEGTSHKAITSSDGRWKMDGVENGVVSLTFDKEGFGRYRISNLPVDGDLEIADTTYLGQTAAASLLIDGVTVSTEFGDSAYVVTTHLSLQPPANAQWTVGLLFVGTSPSVSPDVSTHMVSHGAISAGRASELTFVFFIKGYRNLFQRGQTLYARAYAHSAACSCYDDDATGRRVYPNTGPQSNLISFPML